MSVDPLNDNAAPLEVPEAPLEVPAAPARVDHGLADGVHVFETPLFSPCGECGGVSTVELRVGSVAPGGGWAVGSGYKHAADCPMVRSPCGHGWETTCDSCKPPE